MSARGWIIPVGLAVGVGALLAWRQTAVAEQRVRLEGVRLAAARPAADDAAAEQLRQRVAALAATAPAEHARLAEWQARRQALQERLATATAPATPAARPERYVAGVTLPSSEWHDAGNATPGAAFETALWAALGGDVRRLADTLMFAPDGAREAADRLWADVPARERQRYGTPEQLVAGLTVPRVPMGALTITGWSDSGNPGEFRSVEAQLTSSDGERRRVALGLSRANDGWKLVVTRQTIERLAAQLTR